MKIVRTIFALFLAASGGQSAEAQCGGETPAVSPCLPRIIPGTPGVHEVIVDVSTAAASFIPACGLNVGHAVWFEVTPSISGLLTFSTCHPSTSYDTVLQPWLATGDCEFPQRLDELCVDDTSDPACVSPCSPTPRSSSVTFSAVAATTYFFEVGSYNNNSDGCALCLGVRVTICGGDTTPPTTMISSPTFLDCSCDPVNVVGTVDESDGALQSYTLEYAAGGSPSWALISSGSSSIINGVLGIWSTSGLAQGYYVLRLTATNVCGLTSSSVQTVWVEGGFDTVDYRSPAHTAVVGGLVCLDGTVNDQFCFNNYTAEYRPAGGGAFQPVDPGNPTYTHPVINDPLALWDTASLGLPDGDYEMEVQGINDCGYSSSVSLWHTVDNTPPIASISSPFECDYVDGVVQITGTANDANLQSWTLQYAGGGSGWTNIVPPSAIPVVNGVLANWDTTSLPACAYMLRLVVSDTAILNCNAAITHRSEDTVAINLGFCGDFDADDDGDVDLIDYSAFDAAFTGPIP